MLSNSIVLENKYAKISISSNGLVESVYDKVFEKEISSEKTYFFHLIEKDRETKCIPDCIEYENGVFKISTSLGEFKVKVEEKEDYFTFELCSKLPENSYKAVFAHIKYDYDLSEKKSGAAGKTMTYTLNPCFFPDGKDKETKGEVLSYLENYGAKYAFFVAPFEKHRAILEDISRHIDINKGITLENGGALGSDVKLNKGNWIMQFDNSVETVKKSIPFYKALGIDIVDYHKQYHEVDRTFLQGDFSHFEYETADEFKENVIKPLEENGMVASLHTYAYLIDFKCESLLTDAEYQKDLKRFKEFTLKEFDGNLIKVEECIDDVTDESGFVMCTSPYLLIGEEIIKFKKTDDGFLIEERQVAKTKKETFKKGDKVYQLEARFGGFTPVLGSKLFLKVAQNTADVYNEYGYKALYIDALDAVLYDCDRNEDEMAYYMSMFTCEILKHCIIPPVYDCSIRRPCLWASRGRVGNFDTPYRGYKNWNINHARYAQEFKDMYLSPSLGWYSFYREPQIVSSGNFDANDLKCEPGNFDKKYQHTDAVHHIGSLSLMHNASMTYIEVTPEEYEDCPARKRNIDLYKKYDDLRKAEYFSEDVVNTIKNGEYEYHIEEVSENEYVLREKDFKVKKFYNLTDESRNSIVYNNPFDAQTPFVRFEALLSAEKENLVTVAEFDKNKELKEQLVTEFKEKLDISETLARKVTVKGNGKKGGAIGIKLKSFVKNVTQYFLYIIDTDFEGEREFVLIETESGEHLSYGFDKEWNYATYRQSLSHNKIEKLEIETTGDVDGVKISDITASKHTYETFINPVIKAGDTEIKFICELKSCEFIEFDGKTAKVIDGVGNERKIEFVGSLTVPSGEFTLSASAESQSGNILRADLTLGFNGKIIK